MNARDQNCTCHLKDNLLVNNISMQLKCASDKVSSESTLSAILAKPNKKGMSKMCNPPQARERIQFFKIIFIRTAA